MDTQEWTYANPNTDQDTGTDTAAIVWTTTILACAACDESGALVSAGARGVAAAPQQNEPRPKGGRMINETHVRMLIGKPRRWPKRWRGRCVAPGRCSGVP